MDTRGFRPESHVAQQSRRDKLRFQQSVQHLEDYPNFEIVSVHPLGLNPDHLVHVRNVRNGNILYHDPSSFSSEMMVNFAAGSHVLSTQEDAIVNQELAEDSSFTTNMAYPFLPPNFSASPKGASTSDPAQGCGNWRSLDDSQPSYDLMVNYAGGGERINQKPLFVGEVLSNNATRVTSNISTSRQYLMPSYVENQDVQLQSISTFPSCEDAVTLASIGRNNERVLYPSSYENQSTASQFDNANTNWIRRSSENYHQWSGEFGLVTRSYQELRTIASNANNTQGLSLSLSSNPSSKVTVARFGQGYASEHHLQSEVGALDEPHQDSKITKSTNLCSIPKPAIISKGCGKSLQDIVGTSAHVCRNTTGPLGPFTGYATILKSSRFLKPAQELMDEFCCMTSAKLMRGYDEVSEKTSGDQLSASDLADAINEADRDGGAKGKNNSVISPSSAFYSSNDGTGGDGGVGSSSYGSYRPEFQQKKAKLLFLQEEVCRRYKQYHQQMQMVASSFESVAGLSGAAPYVSLALKTVSRNFRSLKLAISDQLKHVAKSLGEDLFCPNTVSGGSKGDTSTSRLRYLDHSFQKNKSGGVNVGYLEPQQHIWRPQRGLPERSVAVLRAWLFEHFLHPYPTDADKHMLATQTGLSRNQVSNWFINARVRIWKPMVEEIHMLETKGLAESSGKNDNNSAEATSLSNVDHAADKHGTHSMRNKQVEYSDIGSSGGSGEQMGSYQWNREKRSLEFQVPNSVDGSPMNFLPYQRSGIDNGGLGAVSLTLGLKHGIENAQHHQQQMQQHENQFKQQFGGQMIRDFVG